MKKTKSKTKICLSLLIAVAFILPSATVFGYTNAENSTEVTKDASDINNLVTRSTTTKTNPGIETIDYRSGSGSGIVPLAYNNGWPIEVDSINIGSPIASGAYDIEATFCRPDFSTGSPEVSIHTDADLEGNPATAHADDNTVYREDGNYYNGAFGDFDLDVELDCDTDMITITLNNPADISGRWNQAGEFLDITRDYNGGHADWVIRYNFGGT
jgi:hypothetical protein